MSILTPFYEVPARATLVELLVARHARAAALAFIVAGLVASLGVFALIFGIGNGWPFLALFVTVPPTLAPVAFLLARRTIRRRLERGEDSALALAGDARAVEAGSSAATMIFGALVLLNLITAVTLVLPFFIFCTFFLFPTAWILPFLVVYAFVTARRWARTPTAQLERGRPVLLAPLLLVAVNVIGYLVVRREYDFELTPILTGACALQTVTLFIGQRVAYRRVLRERAALGFIPAAPAR